jgi:hypothetical protein
MFPLAFLAAPLLQNVIGKALGGLFNQGNQGCHGHHGHNHGQGINQRLAAEDFKDAHQKFSRGDIAGGMEEMNEGMGRLAQGPGPVLSERTTQRILAAEDRKDAFQDFSRGQFGSGFEELREASRRSWY